MELLRLKKRIQLAHRGHKLLKDKQDELVRNLLLIINQIRTVHESLKAALGRAYDNMAAAEGFMGRDYLDYLLARPLLSIGVGVEERRILNIKVPDFKVEARGVSPYPLSFYDSSVNVDAAFLSLKDALPVLFKLASLLKALEMLSDEIEKTRRRVNALEYVLIPDLKETIRYITMKIGEAERSNQTRLMKIKEIVRKH